MRPSNVTRLATEVMQMSPCCSSAREVVEQRAALRSVSVERSGSRVIARKARTTSVVRRPRACRQWRAASAPGRDLSGVRGGAPAGGAGVGFARCGA
jgi:hypothetical protein